MTVYDRGVETQRQWRPGRFWTAGAALWVIFGLVRVYQAAVGDIGSSGLVSGLLITAIGLLVMAVTGPRKVTADADGVVVRRAFWRSTVVPWKTVSDIRTTDDRAGSLLVIVRHDKSLVPTGLHPLRGGDDLVEYWRNTKAGSRGRR